MFLPKKIGDYSVIKELGNGAYGVVYQVIKENNPTILVLKQISLKNLKPEEKKNIENEANLLKELNSKYIVKYIESFEKDNFLNIIMEYCDQGDLGLLLKTKKKTNQLIAEKWVWKLFLQISIGLAYLHKKNILHRDLKSLNIFLKGEFEVKIGDLGVAKKLEKQKFAKTFIGTPYYLSPEICEDREYNDKSDVWALGCILYELCSYKHLYEANSQGALILKIMTAPIPQISNCYSEQLRNLLKDILIKDDRKRPSVKDILNMNSVVENAKKFGLYKDVCDVIGNKNDKVVIVKKNTNVQLNEANKVKFQSNIKINHNYVNNNLINEGRFNPINKVGSNNLIANNNFNYINYGQYNNFTEKDNNLKNVESERNKKEKNIKNVHQFNSEVNVNKNQIKNLENEINENLKQNKIKIKPIIITEKNDKLNNNNNKDNDLTASSTLNENIKKTNSDNNNNNNNNNNINNNINDNNNNNNNINDNNNNNKKENIIPNKPRESVKKKLRKPPKKKDKNEEFIIEENKEEKILKSKTEKKKINKKNENSDSESSQENISNNKNLTDDSDNDDEEETVQIINKNKEKEKILLKIEEQKKELKNLIGLKDFNYINSLYIQTINSNDDTNKYYTEIEKFFNENYSEEKKIDVSSIYFNLVILSIQLKNVELDDD